MQGNIRAWLLSIARNSAIDVIRSRKRLERLGIAPIETIEYAGIDDSQHADPEQSALQREVADLVWEAASSLTPAEYALLDLHVRQGMDADDLAQHLGARKGSVNVRLFRLRGSLRKSVIAALLWRQPGDCGYLAGLKREHGGAPMSNAARRAILLHVDDCRICQETRRRFANPVEIFAGLALVPMPESSKLAIWEAVSAAVAGALAGAAVAGSLALKLGNLFRWIGQNVRNIAVGGGAAGAAVAAAVAAAALLGGTSSPQVTNPPDLHAVDLAVNQTTTDNRIRVIWSRQDDVAGYSIEWNNTADTTPDEEPDLPGGATEALSPPLTDGTWHFHLRTRGDRGDWSGAVHAGPFLVARTEDPPPPQTRVLPATQVPAPPAPAGAGAVLRPPRPASAAPGLTPSPTPVSTPTGAPTATPKPQPSATAKRPVAAISTSSPAAPSPTPTPTPSPTRTPTATLTPSATPTATSSPTASCGGMTPTISGGNDRDILDGTRGDDVIAGLGGNDVIHGHGGNDVICGGPGDDHLFGGDGNDAVSGEDGADKVFGQAGDDSLTGGAGPDDCHGGPGTDVATLCETLTDIP